MVQTPTPTKTISFALTRYRGLEIHIFKEREEEIYSAIVTDSVDEILHLVEDFDTPKFCRKAAKTWLNEYITMLTH